MNMLSGLQKGCFAPRDFHMCVSGLLVYKHLVLSDLKAFRYEGHEMPSHDGKFLALQSLEQEVRFEYNYWQFKFSPLLISLGGLSFFFLRSCNALRCWFSTLGVENFLGGRLSGILHRRY